jgi:hypothetical protein
VKEREYKNWTNDQKGDRFIFYKLKINPLPLPRSAIENFDDFGKNLNENNL